MQQNKGDAMNYPLKKLNTSLCILIALSKLAGVELNGDATHLFRISSVFIFFNHTEESMSNLIFCTIFPVEKTLRLLRYDAQSNRSLTHSMLAYLGALQMSIN